MGAPQSRSPVFGWYEEDLQYFGVPFFSMDHVEGLVPSDNIPYTMEGWVMEASPEQQERMWWSGHRRARRGAPHRLAGHPARVAQHPGRGSRGSSSSCPTTATSSTGPTKGEKVPVIESTWQWLVEHKPAEDGDVVISWGDSRIGNIIWDDFQAAAVVDWEMASLAQPELDLGCGSTSTGKFSEGLGVPRPSGFGSHEETIGATPR